ncbi:MAG: hypothetical protein H6553_10160 [Chitinophagales bacterium]|nr:hypothetical protein [Chitinophagales bacterium]
MLKPLEYYYPNESFNDLKLDLLLNTGYFRTGNYMMRTRILYFDNNLMNAFHIRINLRQHEWTKSLRKLINKNNKIFTYTIKPFQISAEKNALYAKHKVRFKGDTSSYTLEHFLYDMRKHAFFNSYEINIYHNNKLIAFSIFDVGQESIASILGVFEQDYHKYSLGIYTMLLEIEYAKQHQFSYYYPGYITDIDSPFNYKLRLGNMDYYDWMTEKWLSYQNDQLPTKISDWYDNELTKLESWLIKNDLEYIKMTYPFYYLGYMYPQSSCVKSFQHLLIKTNNTNGVYYIFEYNPVLKLNILAKVELHRNFDDDSFYFPFPTNNKWKQVLIYQYPYVAIDNDSNIKECLLFLMNHISENNDTIQR